MHASRIRLISCWLALMVAGLLATTAAAHVHIRLDASTPARDEVVTESPPHLRLVFSARIEARYTSLRLLAPNGAEVHTGDIVFIGGSDREITALLPHLAQPGSYTVQWRTAGADGHVLEGSWSFVLAVDGSRAEPVQDTAAAAASPMQDAHADHEEPEAVGGVKDAIGRGLHFVALLLVLGSVGFRVLLMPRLDIAEATRAVLRQRMWRTLAAAALLLAAAALLRLWLQSTALHGAERAWNTELLSIMLSDTSWGRAWVLQTFAFAVLGMAIVWALPGRDRAALFVAVPAVAGLAAIPALSGHAAGATGFASFAVVNDTFHVAAAGAWLGTLALLMIVALPAIRRLEPKADGAAADAVDRFSPIALTAAAIVVVSGVINGVMHLGAPAQLWTTAYGRTLLVKVALVAVVVVAGFINWRIVRPRLRDGGGMRRLRASAATELVFALLVLTATAVLTGQPRP